MKGDIYQGRRWSISPYDVGNGSKIFGVEFWFNSQRACLQLTFWTKMLYIMRER